MTSRALFICHGHPMLAPGGAEVAAYDLFRRVREDREWDAVFLARDYSSGIEGVEVQGIPGRPGEMLWPALDYDPVFLTRSDKLVTWRALERLLETYAPHVVHVQHSDGLGLDLLPAIRRLLPDVPIVYTLHEFLPICNARGWMVRPNGELCDASSPGRCNRCFPKIPPADFHRRERFVKDRLALVDLFLCPSRFLLQRYVEWGIEPERLRYQQNGCPFAPRPQDLASEPPIGHFAFFGQMARHKGILVLLHAIQRLQNSGFRDFRVLLHGGNLEFCPEDFQQQLAEEVERCRDLVTLTGRYEAAEIPDLMEGTAWVVVPSLWWENAPLVIDEAFAHRRPVICSHVGGMAERVPKDIAGLHFRLGDPESLAATMRRAATDPSLWRHLRDGIPRVYTLDASAADHVDIYRRLIERRSRLRRVG